MTDIQECAFFELVDKLRDVFGPIRIHGHNEFSSKACPCFNVITKGGGHSLNGILRRRRKTKAVKNNRHGEGSEYEIQKRFAKYIDTEHPNVLWCASTGGARTSMNEANRMKATGYKRGFPDVFVYEPRGAFHGLAIELKKDSGGRVSQHQKEWQRA